MYDYEVTKRVAAPYHHGSLRRTLLQVASAMVEREGEHAVSVREIARIAGVSAAAPFRHFKDKDDLLDAVAEEARLKFQALVQAETDEAKGDPLLEFRAYGRAFVRFAVRSPRLFELAVRRAGGDPMGERSAAESKARIEKAQHHGAILDAGPDAIFLAAGAMTQGLCRMIIDGHFGKLSVAQAEKVCDAAFDILGAGLMPRG